jgi:spore coat polysaccharide biosynthesis protein SpsF
VMEEPALFRIRHVVADVDASDLRLTVDTAEDLAVVRGLDAALGLAAVPPARALIAHLRAHPELAALNAHVEQKSWKANAHA